MLRFRWSDSGLVEEASVRIKEYLTRKNGNRLPRSFTGWAALARDCGLVVRPYYTCRSRFQAKTCYDEDTDTWVILYNPYASAWERCLYLCHEIFEYIAHGELADLFADLPGGYYFAYDGGMNPHDLRHLIGRRGEQLCFRTKKIHSSWRAQDIRNKVVDQIVAENIAKYR